MPFIRDLAGNYPLVMTLHQLKVFVAVAKAKSYSQAGEELRLHQPSVSITIRALERELQVKLFENLGRKVHLTTAGEELFSIADEILPKVGEIKERLAEVGELKKGKITVGGSALAAAAFLPIAVHMFKKQHPGVEVALKIQKSRFLEKKLLNGEFHVGILGRPSRHPLLTSEPYCQESVVAFARPDHPLSQRKSVPLKLLAEEPLIISERGAAVRQAIEETFTEQGLVLTPRLEVDTELGARDTVKNSVTAGLGIGFLSQCHVIDSVRGGQLKILNVPEISHLKRTMYLTVHRNRSNSLPVQAFVNFLRGFDGHS